MASSCSCDGPHQVAPHNPNTFPAPFAAPPPHSRLYPMTPHYVLPYDKRVYTVKYLTAGAVSMRCMVRNGLALAIGTLMVVSLYHLALLLLSSATPMINQLAGES